MNRRFISALTQLLIFCFGGNVFSQTNISIQPTNGTAIYTICERAKWDIYIEKDSVPYDGDIGFEIKKGGLKVVDQGRLILKNGKASIQASRSDAGALIMCLNVESKEWDLDKKQIMAASGGGIFNYENIKPSAEMPADFNIFWNNKLAELDEVPMNARLEKIENDNVDLWKITLDNIRGTKIYGHLAKPKNVQGKLPAMACFEGAGVRAANENRVIGHARNGWLVINIIAHSIPPDREPDFYTKLSNGKLKDYAGIGRENRDSCYFLRMMLATSRIVDYLAQHPDWNGDVLRVNGGSQGGWQSIAAAYLNPKVTLLTAKVPAGCDHTGYLVEREPGWPKAFCKEKEAIETSKYFDAVNFARSIHCPALIGVGAIDPVCPPEGVCAMFNQLKGPKHLLILANGAHGGVGHKPYYDFMAKWDKEWQSDEATLKLEMFNGY